MGNTTVELQRWLELLRAGDDRGREELIKHACERLRKLTRRMLTGFPLVKRQEQTDDVLQNSLMRLYRALAEVTPDSLRHFYNLAALQIRRELLDLAKHQVGHEGQGAESNPSSGESTRGLPSPLEQGVDDADEAIALETWTEFHAQVAKLPEREREVFDLLWYEGLTQEEAAGVLDTSLRTVKRRWLNARLRLYQAMHGESPE